MAYKTPNSKSSNDGMSKFLNILVLVLNEQDDENNYVLGKEYCLQDFDCLTSNEMLKILVRLTKDIIPGVQPPSAPSSKITKLNDFAQFEIGGLTYDNEIDRIYNAIKRIIPADIPIHYSAFLLPAKDPKLTKAILISVMSFYIMSDTLYGRLNEEFDQVVGEALEKAELFNEIEDIREKIGETVQSRIRDKDRVPLLENEIKTIQQKIRQEQIVLSKMKDEVSKVEGAFKREELELNTLNEQVKRLETKRSNLYALLVPNPQEIMIENVTLKKQLEVETAQRDECGSKVSTCRQKVDEFEGLIQEADHFLLELQSAIPHLEKVKFDSQQLSIESDVGEINAQSETLKIELEQLIKQYNTSVKEIARKEQRHEVDIRDLNKKAKSLERLSTQIRKTIKEEKLSQFNIKLELGEIQRCISVLKGNISKHIHTRKVDIPTMKLALEQGAKEKLDLIFEVLGDFSVPSP